MSQQPTLYMVGDSTMKHAGNLTGWGGVIGDTMNIPVLNKAKEFQSARSYYRELWSDVAKSLKTGDFVVICLGLNDDGEVSNGRSPVPECSEPLKTTYKDQEEVVETFTAYIGHMVDQSLERGAIPIVASHTAEDPFCGGGSKDEAQSQWVRYAEQVSKEKNAVYVDLWLATKSLYTNSGPGATKEWFLKDDENHTTPAGALAVTKCFRVGLIKAEEGITEDKKLSVHFKPV